MPVVSVVFDRSTEYLLFNLSKDRFGPKRRSRRQGEPPLRSIIGLLNAPGSSYPQILTAKQKRPANRALSQGDQFSTLIVMNRS